MHKSCIVEQFERHAELSDAECELLDSLESEPKAYGAGEYLRAEGDKATHFYTLRSGWAYSSRTLADGERQVLDIFLPGQIIGLREIGFDKSLCDIVFLNDAVACPFPKSRLDEIFTRSPRLASLFFLSLAREESLLIERIVNISRRSAAQRLAHFILEMKLRLHESGDEFELPMNQSIIGDALGLSAVHVSRTLKCIRDEGLVTLTDGLVTINNIERLIEYAGFNPAYLNSMSAFARRADHPNGQLQSGVRDAVGVPAP